ncbi:hypothetical protein [Helicobacter cetorum]|uniref:Uncharacterized protein n=1 Tax=Helicobacter cetorum (strain ATCC BAA-540 / CCUG 52418 / MIT 99-5656) TaxID=1163745 RepID=I0EST1_HELCM|nr:hypothetical protein [Helicobacter cetorum]AFI05224.1 hypothetical protein HCD_00960 [Helicobacter cetorum MIT 99-5656]AFI06000.1 hypothetical protein HCD_04990 [Helicobacter cetorum MIT 99-5656]
MEERQKQLNEIKSIINGTQGDLSNYLIDSTGALNNSTIKEPQATNDAPLPQATQDAPLNTQEPLTKPLNILNNQNQATTNDATLPKTGIARLDQKIAQNKLDALDYLVAKKYLGIDLNVTLNGNLNLKNDMTLKNPSKPIEAINANADSIDGAIRFLKTADNQAGILYGANKFLNKISYGLLGMTHGNSKLQQSENNMVALVAKSNAGGKPPSEYDKRDAKDSIALWFRGQKELGSKTAQLLQALVDKNKNADTRLLALNGINPKEFQAKNYAALKIVEMLNKNEGNYNTKELENTYNNAYSNYMKGN